MISLTKRFIRLPIVQDKTGWSKSSIYLGVSRGTFPRPISLGARAVAWVETEIDDWLSSRIALSRAMYQKPLNNGANTPGRAEK